MSLDDTIDTLLRENEVSVMDFIDLIEEDNGDIEGKGDQLCSMFSVFAESLLRELADGFDSTTWLSGEQTKEVLEELADRIKHRSITI